MALETGGFEVCAEAGTADAAARVALEQHPDICLLDLALPGEALAAAARIHEHLEQTAILLLADDVSDENLFDALHVGVSGFVLKRMNCARLPHVLRGVLNGEVALPRELAGRLALEFRGGDRRRFLRVPNAQGVELTMREWEVLEFLRRGLSTREVAMRLGVAPVTVRRHIGSALKKLGVETRAEALGLLEERSVS
jgi:DNA-binding NarL/FixJ family response regulator